ncbi:MAG TPA: hypothetical protein VK464_22220 [Symbiobacteriaceae bacterium]|jgi:hypothetical protein|nr:hypothetical protein [Symbiobacteriaceae bacterium]
MNLVRQEEMLRQFSPEVGRFVLLALRSLEQENVFDAPGVISGVLRQMRMADSDVIRSATARAERLLKATFAQGCLQRMGA